MKYRVLSDGERFEVQCYWGALHEWNNYETFKSLEDAVAYINRLTANAAKPDPWRVVWESPDGR